MDTTPRNDKTDGQVGFECTAQKSQQKRITKLDRVINILKTRPEGLNRFEAESYGDHALNSTVAVIRAMYGNRLIQRWEKVPSRFSDAGVRCLRYWLVGGEYQ